MGGQGEAARTEGPNLPPARTLSFPLQAQGNPCFKDTLAFQFLGLCPSPAGSKYPDSSHPSVLKCLCGQGTSLSPPPPNAPALRSPPRRPLTLGFSILSVTRL